MVRSRLYQASRGIPMGLAPRWTISDVAAHLGKDVDTIVSLIQKQAIPYQFAAGFSPKAASERLVYFERDCCKCIESIRAYKDDIRLAIKLLKAAQNQATFNYIASPNFDRFLLDACGEFHPAPVSIYALFDGPELVYFGQTNNGQRRMEQHRAGGKQFNKTLYLPVPADWNFLDIEAEFIASMPTRYNQCKVAKIAHGLVK